MESIAANKATCYIIAVVIIIMGFVALAAIPAIGVIMIIGGFILLFAFKRAFRGI